MGEGIVAIKTTILSLSYAEMMELSRELDTLIGGVTEILESRGAHNAPLEPAPEIARALWHWSVNDTFADDAIALMREGYWREDFPALKVQVSSPPDKPNDLAEFFSRKPNSVMPPLPGAPSLPIPDRLVLFEYIKKEFGIPFGLAKIKAMGRDGSFPNAVKIDARRVAWVRSELAAWVEKRAQERKN